MAKQNKPSLGTTIRQNSSGVLAALMCIVIGLVIGLIGSAFAMRRYLKV